MIFFLPQNLNVFDEVEKNIEIGGQQNSLFPIARDQSLGRVSSMTFADKLSTFLSMLNLRELAIA